MPKKKPSLKIALEKWLQEQGDIYDLLPEGVDSQVKTADEARLACLSFDRAIANAGTTPDFDAETTVAAVMGLFQDAATPEAARAFAKHGLPRLRKLVREGIAADKDPLKVLTFAVKMLAVYGLAEDADLIVDAARAPCLQDSYLWSIVFRELQSQQALALPVLDRLRRPLPSGFAAVAYLDYANALALEGAVEAHPFDTASGHAHLKDWLSCTGETSSYAVSAAAALPFVASEARADLVKQALTHPDAKVQLEASWVAARGGDREGLDRLQKYALDPRYSGQAIRYLGGGGRNRSNP
jgi:hypothetical protein